MKLNTHAMDLPFVVFTGFSGFSIISRSLITVAIFSNGDIGVDRFDIAERQR